MLKKSYQKHKKTYKKAKIKVAKLNLAYPNLLLHCHNNIIHAIFYINDVVKIINFTTLGYPFTFTIEQKTDSKFYYADILNKTFLDILQIVMSSLTIVYCEHPIMT